LEQTINGAKGLLVNVTSSEDLTLTEATEAMNYIQSLCDSQDANIFFGTVVDPTLDGTVRVTVLATGFLPDSPGAEKAMEALLGQAVVATSTEPAKQRLHVNPTTRREPVAEAANVFDESDLDIPAFIREHRN